MQNFVGKTKCIAGYMKVANMWASMKFLPVFKSLYVIVLRLGKTFEDHVFQTNQLGSRVHI